MTTDILITPSRLRGQLAYRINYGSTKGHIWIIKNHYRQEVTIMKEFLSDYTQELDKEGLSWVIK